MRKSHPDRFVDNWDVGPEEPNYILETNAHVFDLKVEVPSPPDLVASSVLGKTKEARQEIEDVERNLKTLHLAIRRLSQISSACRDGFVGGGVDEPIVSVATTVPNVFAGSEVSEIRQELDPLPSSLPCPSVASTICKGRWRRK